jgi:hypothetical protein
MELETMKICFCNICTKIINKENVFFPCNDGIGGMGGNGREGMGVRREGIGGEGREGRKGIGGREGIGEERQVITLSFNHTRSRSRA